MKTYSQTAHFLRRPRGNDSVRALGVYVVNSKWQQKGRRSWVQSLGHCCSLSLCGPLSITRTKAQIDTGKYGIALYPPIDYSTSVI